MNEFQAFSSYEARRRPDQQTAKLNTIRQHLVSQQYQLVVKDSKSEYAVVVGQQPKPNSGQFGIVKYKIKGDALEEVERLM